MNGIAVVHRGDLLGAHGSRVQVADPEKAGPARRASAPLPLFARTERSRSGGRVATLDIRGGSAGFVGWSGAVGYPDPWAPQMSSGVERRTLEELARCAKAGDRRCAEQLFREIGPFVASAAARREYNAEDARDLAQDVAVRVAVGLKTYDPSRPFKPWLFTILRNANREMVEKKQRMRTRKEKLEGEAAIDGGVRLSAGIHLSEFLIALRRCISRIDSEVRREITWMHLVDRLSEADLEREFPAEGSLRRHLKHDLRAVHRCIYPDVEPYRGSGS